MLPITIPSTTNEDPHYLHRDHPSTAARRARLRFGRALLLSFMHQRGFEDAPNPYCQSCPTGTQIEETVTHTITTCNHYVHERMTCQRELDAAMRDAPLNVLPAIADSSSTVLCPELSFRHDDKKYKKHLNQVISITGKFIEAVYEKRKF